MAVELLLPRSVARDARRLGTLPLDDERVAVRGVVEATLDVEPLLRRLASLRVVDAIRLQLLLVDLLDGLDGALWVEQDVVGGTDVPIEGCPLLALEKVGAYVAPECSVHISISMGEIALASASLAARSAR